MRRKIPAVVPLALVLVAACSSASPASEPNGRGTHSAPSRTADPGHASKAAALPEWTQYHHGPSRSGHVAQAPGSPLHHAWRASLGNAVYGEPLVVGGTLIAATEGNDVFGLDPRTGAQLWKTNLGTPQPLSGLPCGNIDPLGITGTPAYDPTTGSVFMVAETVGGNHTLWALDAANGHRRWHRSLDVLPTRNRKAEQQRSAVLVEHGRVVVSFGGLAGDCDNYVGYVTSTRVDGTGPIFHYAVPTAREAGMWATPGPVLGRNGHVYVASGNGAELHGRWDRSDSVTELSPVTMRRLSVFAPSTWRQDNIRDLDLGSSSPAMLPGLQRMVIAGKRGVVYLLRESFHGVGSAVATRSGCSAFGGPAVAGRSVLMPCLFEHQVRLLHVGRSSLRWGWTRSNLYGSPVIAGPRVYVTDRDSGDLVALRLSDGHLVQRIHAGPATHFPSQAVSGRFVFVPTLNGVAAFRG
jgi:outer membrane protein assembly factor BamB